MQALKPFNLWGTWWCGIPRSDLHVHRLLDTPTFKLARTYLSPPNQHNLFSKDSHLNHNHNNKCNNKDRHHKRKERIHLILEVVMRTKGLLSMFKAMPVAMGVLGRDGEKGLGWKIVLMSLNHCSVRLTQVMDLPRRRLVKIIISQSYNSKDLIVNSPL